MSHHERMYLDPNQARDLIHAYEKRQKDGSANAPEADPVSTEEVRETGQRAAQAVGGLRLAYSGSPEPEAPGADPDRTSGEFLVKKGADGSVVRERVRPSAPDAQMGQMQALEARAKQVGESYTQSVMDVNQAEEEIARLRAEQRTLADFGDVYSDQGLMRKAKRIAEDLDGWMRWREARSKAAERYAAVYAQQGERLQSMREAARAKERQAQVPMLRQEYVGLLRKGEAYSQSLIEVTTAIDGLRSGLAQAMQRDVERAQELKKAPKRDLWSFFRRFRSDGVEENRPEFGAKVTQPGEEVKALLTQIGEMNRKVEALMAAKAANDRRMDELAERIQGIEQPAIRQAA